MSNDVQGRALAVLNKVAQAEWPDRFKLRKPFEKLLFNGSRAGFRFVAQRSAKPSSTPRPANSDGLFDLSLNEDQQMLVEMLDGFAQEVLRPAAHDADAAASISAELRAQVAELGLAHYGVPESLGGLAGERTVVTNALLGEALAKGDLSLAASFLVPLSAANCIRRFASQAQQAQWLPEFVSEAGAAAYALAVTEAALLNDPAKPSTKARKSGSHYLLSGEKSLVIEGLNTQWLIVSAQTSQGAALFRVPADAPGVTRKAEPAMGLKACGTAKISLNKVKVSRDDKLSGEHFNFRSFLDLSALAWCALAIGCGQAALDYVIGYANERTAFGEPISHRQSVAFMIADMAIELDAMRVMVWRACARAERGEPFAREAYLARLLCSEKAMKIGTDAVQLLGGHGFTKEHPVERWYRDLRAVAIQAGGLHL